MTSIAVRAWIAAAVLALGPGLAAGEPPDTGSDAPYARTPEQFVPYRDFGSVHRQLFPEPLPYLGPGAEEPAPQGLDEVAIGLLVPAEGSPDWLEGRGMKMGIELATEEANAAGGIDGRPLRLLEHEDLPVWGASSNAIVTMAYEQKVWAILGSVGGDSSHIAIRVALKAQVPVMNTATSDPTLTETGIPWAFRCVADDRQLGYALAQHIFLDQGLQRVAILRSNDRYGRFGVGELRDAALRTGRPIIAEVQWRREDEDFAPLVERIRSSRPDGVVLWGGPTGAAKALRLLRQAGVEVPVFGPARLGFDRFLEQAGEAAEGLVVATTLNPSASNPRWQRFQEAFRMRFGEDPDAPAAHGYDGMTLVVESMRRAGLNRVRIRDELAAVRSYQGVSGQIEFDNTFNDVGEVFLATVSKGRFEYRSADSRRSDAALPAIGLLRPDGGEQTGFGRDVEQGVRLALADFGGSMSLAVAGTRGPWSTVGEAARDLIQDRGVVGLVTALDSQGAHLAAQVATRLRTPISVAGDSPALLAHTGVPWILTPATDDRSGVSHLEVVFSERFMQQHPQSHGEAVKAGYVATQRLLEHLNPSE